MAKTVKDSIKAGVVPKGKRSAKSSNVKKAKKEVSDKVSDVTSKLPDDKKSIYITAKTVGEAKPVKVNVDDIKATSQQVHVNDIHSANPEILAKVYYIIMPNTAYVVLRVSETEYNDLLAKPIAKKINHLYSVVDHAVFPSLTYGSWKLDEISNELPDKDQIFDYDEKFKKMDVHFHNQPVYGTIGYEEDELDIDFSDEDEVEIDFSDGDDELTDEEEDEFDFSEEED